MSRKLKKNHTILFELLSFLAHLSQRLIGDLPMVQRPSLSVLRPSFKMLKHLLRNHSADLNQILFGVSLGRGTKFCSWHVGRMTKMAATAIYGKNPSKIFFSRTGGPIFTKLGMYYRGLQPIIVCSNDDPGVTWTYLTAMSNLVT